MQSTSATKLLPIVSDEEKLEVSLDGNEVTIKLSTWEEDLGWCGQKTLRINVEMLDDLHRAIAAVRYKVKKEKISTESDTNSVIKFPNI